MSGRRKWVNAMIRYKLLEFRDPVALLAVMLTAALAAALASVPVANTPVLAQSTVADTRHPRVIEMRPAEGATDVSIVDSNNPYQYHKVVAFFSEDMKERSMFRAIQVFKKGSNTHNGKIAFSRLDNRDGQSDIFVMKADGTGVKRLATKPAGDTSPAFSPNGERLAFEAESRSRNTPFDIDIYVMNADGSEAYDEVEGPRRRSQLAAASLTLRNALVMEWVAPGQGSYGSGLFMG